MNSDGFAHLLKLNSIIFQEALYFLCNPGSAAQCVLFGTCGFDIVVDDILVANSYNHLYDRSIYIFKIFLNRT